MSLVANISWLDKIASQKGQALRLCHLHDADESFLAGEPLAAPIHGEGRDAGMRAAGDLLAGVSGAFESLDGFHEPIVTCRYGLCNHSLRLIFLAAGHGSPGWATARYAWSLNP